MDEVAATTDGRLGFCVMRGAGGMAGCDRAAGFDAGFASAFFGAVFFGAVLRGSVLCLSVLAACGLAACALSAGLASGFLASCDFVAAEGFAAAGLDAAVRGLADLVLAELAAEAFAAWGFVALLSGAACAPVISASDPAVAINIVHRHADARANVITASFARINPGARPDEIISDCANRTSNVLSISCLPRDEGDFAAVAVAGAPSRFGRGIVPVSRAAAGGHRKLMKLLSFALRSPGGVAIPAAGTGKPVGCVARIDLLSRPPTR